MPAPSEARRPSFFARHRKKLIAAALVVALPSAAHLGVAAFTRIDPPAITTGGGEVTEPTPGLRTLGDGYVRHRGSILEVRLGESPEAIGYAHSRLLYPEMVANEGALYGQFRHYVPLWPVRALIMDIARLQFRHVDQGIQERLRREVAAQAVGFRPDPYEDVLPTYHRFIFLQSLYDISLSFEHSPLLGCTSFALTDGAFEGGHAVLARNFDFEAGPVFDVGKAVFLVFEEGRIPYASVSWPGLVGAVTGMNAEGVAVVVHGGRAGHPQATGEPVLHAMRDVLGRAKTTAEAIGLLEGREPMVSHMVMIVDASGDVAIAERAPKTAMFVRRSRGKVPLTNHFEGPLATDPANVAIEQHTSTWPRRKRLDELLSNLSAGASVQQVVDVLRDKKGEGGVELPLGSRRAIDALIATHSVVMDATARSLWVSEGPHLTGRYLRFDLAKMLTRGYDPTSDADVESLPADVITTDGRYEAWVRAGSPHRGERE